MDDPPSDEAVRDPVGPPAEADSLAPSSNGARDEAAATPSPASAASSTRTSQPSDDPVARRTAPTNTAPSGWGVVWLIRALSLAPLLVGLATYLLHPSFQQFMDEGVKLLVANDRDGLRAWAEQSGAAAPLATTLLMIVQALAAPIPAVLVTATNSLLFGWILGAILSILSATLASLICYGLARSFGEPLLERFVSNDALQKSDEFLSRHGAAAVLVSRLLPFVPFDPIGYVAGAVRMPLWTFTWATIVGQIPAGFFYSYAAQTLDDPKKLLMVLGFGLSGLVVIGAIARRYLLQKGVNPG